MPKAETRDTAFVHRKHTTFTGELGLHLSIFLLEYGRGGSNLARNERIATGFRKAPKKRVRWNHRTALRAPMRASDGFFSNNVSKIGKGPIYGRRLKQ